LNVKNDSEKKGFQSAFIEVLAVLFYPQK